MPFEVGTKDCTALSDAELAEMADLCVDREPGFDIGYLSKQVEDWVLITQAREGSKLRGYSFSTLERIGGTPSLLIGLATVDRTAKAEQSLRSNRDSLSLRSTKLLIVFNNKWKKASVSLSALIDFAKTPRMKAKPPCSSSILRANLNPLRR